MTYAFRIAADWGTSNLRVFALDEGGGVLAEASSDDGMGRLTPAQYEPALMALIGGWLDPARVTPVLVCGMAGARQGWIEAAYRAVPCAPVGGPFARPKVESPLIEVFIVPGLSQAEPADVMRGEETQIAGVLAGRPGFSGVVCLPGTHSKWAVIREGRVERFLTLMTGELFALLSAQSVLRHGMADDGEGMDTDAFAAAVRETATEPAGFAASLFRLRAENLLEGLAPRAARSRLSGLLIGIEMASARALWQDEPTLIVGTGPLGRLYATALTQLGASAEAVSGEAMALAGLTRAFANIEEDKS
ncbi:2-dehydro-3-deoxygalactonokinase [Rhizobiaceae bacterium BDR2-2]|uniref:2-dehydro-3-deoxygalactonokinase n=1 Tax=Ectorhizobium quercum TaxID=2965071 RepID=A0AAE3SVM2_9HYPH|nr:2-dehydro-3-deoxygalactonokinase [Ectorhizobium quercum]MCX8998272.1 2-dehydro-3-deoxygalactonokinase [Ectorhizobium quercum]